MDDLGNIIAVNEGLTVILVRTEDGDITQKIEITVVSKIQLGKIEFDNDIHLNQNKITGIDVNNNTAFQIKEKIRSDYIIQIYDYSGQKLSDEDYVGTGCKIRLVDENDVIKMEYDVIVYGDVNGDGKINSVDLLVLQRHILEIKKLSGIFIEAGNINKNGRNPSSLDSLLIQRHILGLQVIEQ